VKQRLVFLSSFTAFIPHQLLSKRTANRQQNLQHTGRQSPVANSISSLQASSFCKTAGPWLRCEGTAVWHAPCCSKEPADEEERGVRRQQRWHAQCSKVGLHLHERENRQKSLLLAKWANTGDTGTPQV